MIVRNEKHSSSSSLLWNDNTTNVLFRSSSSSKKKCKNHHFDRTLSTLLGTTTRHHHDEDDDEKANNTFGEGGVSRLGVWIWRVRRRQRVWRSRPSATCVTSTTFTRFLSFRLSFVSLRDGGELPFTMMPFFSAVSNDMFCDRSTLFFM